jgi:hypothetical protein
VVEISVLRDVEILLQDASRIGKKRPVGTDSGAIFIRLSDIVGANRDKPAIANLELTMECNKPFMLPTIFGAKTSAAEDEKIGCCPCNSESFRCFPVWSESS